MKIILIHYWRHINKMDWLDIIGLIFILFLAVIYIYFFVGIAIGTI